MSDILVRIRDLYHQATTEHSHYYTATTLAMCANEIERLRGALIRIRDAPYDPERVIRRCDEALTDKTDG